MNPRIRPSIINILPISKKNSLSPVSLDIFTLSNLQFTFHHPNQLIINKFIINNNNFNRIHFSLFAKKFLKKKKKKRKRLETHSRRSRNIRISGERCKIVCFLSTWLGSAGKLVAWNTPRRWNWVRSSIGVVVIDLRFEFNAKLFRFLDYSWLDSRRPVADSIRCCSIDVQTLNRQISFPFLSSSLLPFTLFSFTCFFFFSPSSSSLPLPPPLPLPLLFLIVVVERGNLSEALNDIGAIIFLLDFVAVSCFLWGLVFIVMIFPECLLLFVSIDPDPAEIVELYFPSP